MKKRKIAAALLTLGLSACLTAQAGITAWAEVAVSSTTGTADSTGTATTDSTTASSSAVETNDISGWPQGEDITAGSAVVMENSTNTILYSKDMDTTYSPSSAAKIMTSLPVLENCSLTAEVTMTETGVAAVTEENAHISSQIGEVFTVEQCLYAILLASANDITLQMAEYVAGSVDDFVVMMNDRAKELGCTNTVFANPTGLSDTDQYTTAYDMALIMQAAIDIEVFRTITTKVTYTIPATNMSGGARTLSTNFSLVNIATDTYFDGCIGGKAGYTQEAGSVLVTAAERDDMILICVIMYGTDGVTDDEAVTLLNYGYDNFRLEDVGASDFSVLSGGVVVLPATADESSLTTEETTDDSGVITRTYYYSGVEVGSAIVEAENIEEIDTSASETNLQAAKEYSQSHSPIPYILIAAIGIAILAFGIYSIRKILQD